MAALCGAVLLLLATIHHSCHAANTASHYYYREHYMADKFPSCSNWFAGGPIEVCVMDARIDNTNNWPYYIDVGIIMHNKTVYKTRLDLARQYTTFNASDGSVCMTGTLHFRTPGRFGQTEMGVWGDIQYNESTSRVHHYKGELVSLDDTPHPTDKGRWWGIYNLKWRHHPQQSSLSLYSYRGNMIAGAHQLGGGKSKQVTFDFIWGDDDLYARGQYILDDEHRQLNASMKLCPSRTCQTFEGVVTSW